MWPAKKTMLLSEIDTQTKRLSKDWNKMVKNDYHPKRQHDSESEGSISSADERDL